MAPELDGVVLKLNRADRHLTEIRDAVADFNSSEFCDVITELDYKGRPVARFRNVQPVPAEIAAMVGDCVHNFRSALDYLAYAIADAHSGPLSERQARDTGFPLSARKQDFRRKGRGSPTSKMSEMPRRARGAIERCQPYHRRTAPWLWSLRMLDELWGIDKHRLPHLTAAVPTGVQAYVEGINAQRFGLRHRTGPIKEGGAFVVVLGDLPNPSGVRVSPRGLQVDVIFDMAAEVRIVRGRSVLAVLHGARTAIGLHVVPELQPVLRQLFGGFGLEGGPITAALPDAPSGMG